MRTVMAIGTGGGRLLESLVWAACAETLTVPVLRMVWLEPDEQLESLRELLGAYETMRQSLPERRSWTAFTLDTWQLADGTAAEMGGDPLMPALLERLETAAHWRSRAETHPNLAALAYDAQPENLPWMASVMQEHERVVLCGDLSEVWCAAGMTKIARRLKKAGCAASGVAMLSVKAVSQEKETMAADALAMLQAEPLLESTYILGMPEGLRTQKSDAHLIHWLGALAVQAAFDGKDKGIQVFGARRDRFGWADFGAQSEQVRRGYVSLMQLAAVSLAELVPVLEERLGIKPKLGQKRVTWYNVYFRQAHKMTGEELAGLRRQMEALRIWSARFIRWTLEVVAALPPQWQDRSACEAAAESMANQYRRVLDVAGELALMEEEIDRSGMAAEQLVRRGKPEESAADELLRKAKQLRERLTGLEVEQAELEKIAGGAAKREILCRMQQGIDRALASEEKRADNWRAAALRDDMDVERVREGVYRLETHIRILKAERARVDADLAANLSAGLKVPPHLSAVRPWGNDLYDPAWLGMIAQYMITEDDKERRTQAAALLDMGGLTDAVRSLGREAQEIGTLGGLVDEWLATVREEVR